MRYCGVRALYERYILVYKCFRIKIITRAVNYFIQQVHTTSNERVETFSRTILSWNIKGQNIELQQTKHTFHAL